MPWDAGRRRVLKGGKASQLTRRNMHRKKRQEKKKKKMMPGPGSQDHHEQGVVDRHLGKRTTRLARAPGAVMLESSRQALTRTSSTTAPGRWGWQRP